MAVLRILSLSAVFHVFLLIILISLQVFIHSGLCQPNSAKQEDSISGEIKGINTWKAYKSLLETQRRAQKEAMKQLISMANTEKQYQMLNLVSKKVVEVLKDSRSELIATGFAATDEFPEDEALRDSLSQLIQNSLLFADLALRFPTFMHRVFDKDNVARELVKWCLDFTHDTGVTLGTSAEQTIYLASQELNFIERSEDFANPYEDEQEIKLSKLVEEELKKQKKSKKNRGPRLSTRNTEL